MEPTGPEHNEAPPQEKSADSVYVEMRSPVFSYIANKLAPVYKRELDELRQDGSLQKLKDFHRGPFGTLMGQVLDTATAQEQMELPKVTLHFTDEEMKAVKGKIEAPFDAAGRMLHSQLMGELSDKYRAARFEKRIKAVTSKVKSVFKK